jgi:hypothetical protein
MKNDWVFFSTSIPYIYIYIYSSNSSLELFLVLIFNGENPRIYYANPWKNVWIYWNFNTSSWMLNNFKSRITGSTVGNQHKQNSRFCKEIREDKFLFLWRRVHEDASQGMYMSKIEICFFTGSNIAKSESAMLWRMLSRLETCIVYCCIWSVALAKSIVPRKTWQKLWHSYISNISCSWQRCKLNFQYFFIMGV